MGKFYTWTRWQKFKAWWYGTCLGCEHCGRCHASWEKKCRAPGAAGKDGR